MKTFTLAEVEGRLKGASGAAQHLRSKGATFAAATYEKDAALLTQLRDTLRVIVDWSAVTRDAEASDVNAADPIHKRSREAITEELHAIARRARGEE